MTAFSRFLAVIAASLATASAASAMPVANPAPETPSHLTKVSDRYDNGHRYHRRYDRGRNVVHAPFTRVESGHRTVVDAPFVHVHDGRRGTHVVAPFVDIWR